MDDTRLLATVLRAQQEVGLQVLFLPSPKQIRLTGYESFMFKKIISQYLYPPQLLLKSPACVG